MEGWRTGREVMVKDSREKRGREEKFLKRLETEKRTGVREQ